MVMCSGRLSTNPLAPARAASLPMPAKKLPKNSVYLVANGDLRQSANEKCWPAQAAMEKRLAEVVASFGYKLVRAHPYKKDVKHGFIGSQKEGMEVFADIDPTAPLIVAECVWQYSHHLLHGILQVFIID